MFLTLNDIGDIKKKKEKKSKRRKKKTFKMSDYLLKVFYIYQISKFVYVPLILGMIRGKKRERNNQTVFN